MKVVLYIPGLPFIFRDWQPHCYHLSAKNGNKSGKFSCDFYNFRRGLNQQQCIDELNSIFGDEAPSRTSVYRWFTEFNRGRSSLNDEFREGRPKSVVVPKNIDAVRELILQDRHVTYREIEVTLNISGTSIHSILHEHLAVKKICSRWIQII